MVKDSHRQQSSKILEENTSAAEPESAQQRPHYIIPQQIQLRNTHQKSQMTQDFKVPLGSLDSILYLSSLVDQGIKLKIRIPETIIGGRNFDTRYLSNNIPPNIPQVPNRGSFKSVSGRETIKNQNLSQQINQIPFVSSSKIRSSHQVEDHVCNWLQRNIEKSKKGSFVPICIKKVKNSQDNLQNRNISSDLDFFVISALQSFNNGFSKASRYNMSNQQIQDCFILQRYVPSKEDCPQIFRALWKKSKGCKFYKLSSFQPYNGQTTNPVQSNGVNQQSSPNTGRRSHKGENPLQQSEESKAGIQQHHNKNTNSMIKLLTFQELSELYNQVSKIDNQSLTSQLIKGQVIQRNNDASYSKNIKIDLNSRKNLQHLVLQNRIEQEFNIHEQFEIQDKDPKSFNFQKLRSKDHQTQKILQQIQIQLLELVKILNANLLKKEGLELLKLTADFLEDYSDDSILFLQIRSYVLEDLPQQELFNKNSITSGHKRNAQSTFDFEKKPIFQCQGDYCYIQDQPMVPKHIAPIVAQLVKHDYLKVSKKTVLLERENIKDNFRAYNKSEHLFHTMNEQETLLRTSLNDNKDLEVCPSCFHVYEFLQKNYYNSQDSNSQKILTQEEYEDFVDRAHNNQPHNFISPYTRSLIQPTSKQMGYSIEPQSQTQYEKMHLYKQYQQYLNSDEIKEDLIEENKESKEYSQQMQNQMKHLQNNNQMLQSQHQQNEDSQQIEDTGQNDYAIEAEDEEEFEDDELERADQYEETQLQNNDQSYKTRNDITYQYKSQQQFNIGLEENSNSPDFDDRTDFKIPSDVFDSEFKQTAVSGLVQNQRQQNRFLNNMTPQTQNPSRLTHLHQRNNSSQMSQGQPINSQNQFFHARKNSKGSIIQQTIKEEFQETEFNPIPKFDIKPRQSQTKIQAQPLQLIQKDTSKFGSKNNDDSLGSQRQGFLKQNIKQETFNVVEIIQKIQRQKSNSLRNSLIQESKTTQQLITKGQEFTISKQNDTQQNTPTLQEKNQSFTDQKSLKKINSPSHQNLKSESLNQSFTSNSANKKHQIDAMIQTKSIKSGNVQSPSSQCRNIDCQVGESLMNFPQKPPLAQSSSKPLQQKQTTETNLDQRPTSFLETQQNLKNLTSQNSFQSVSQISNNSKLLLRKKTEKKRTSNATNQPEIRVPLITNNEFSPESSFRIIQHQDTTDNILNIPDNNSHLALNNGQVSGRNSNLSSTKNSKSQFRLRSMSLQGKNIQIPQTGQVSNKNTLTIINGQNTDAQVSLQENLTTQTKTAPTLDSKIMKIMGDELEEPPTWRHAQLHNIPDHQYSKTIPVSYSQSPNIQKESDMNLDKNNAKNNSVQQKIDMRSIELPPINDDNQKEICIRDEALENIQEPDIYQNPLLIDEQQKSFRSIIMPEVIVPLTPPMIKFEASPLLTTSIQKLSLLQKSQSKKDSFFGHNLGTSNSQEDEYLVDYLVSNEEGDSLMNSNPQILSIIQNSQTQNRRNTLLMLGEQSSISRNINMYMIGGGGMIGLVGNASGVNNTQTLNKNMLQLSLEKVIEDEQIQ